MCKIFYSHIYSNNINTLENYKVLTLDKFLQGKPIDMERLNYKFGIHNIIKCCKCQKLIEFLLTSIEISFLYAKLYDAK